MWKISIFFGMEIQYPSDITKLYVFLSIPNKKLKCGNRNAAL